jgi:hypothetical protein
MGDAFGEPNCVRFSFAASMENIETAWARIKEALAKLKLIVVGHKTNNGKTVKIVKEAKIVEFTLIILASLHLWSGEKKSK